MPHEALEKALGGPFDHVDSVRVDVAGLARLLRHNEHLEDQVTRLQAQLSAQLDQARDQRRRIAELETTRGYVDTLVPDYGRVSAAPAYGAPPPFFDSDDDLNASAPDVGACEGRF
jgi:hypothetical protein